MRDLRHVPREVWVAAVLGAVLIAAALLAHSMMASPGDRDAPVADPPGEMGGAPASGASSVAGDGGGGTPPAPSFSFSVSPTSARVKSGGSVRYLMTIRPDEGFDAPISLSLSATALYGAVRRTQDLGTIGPPYDPVAYVFVAPDLPFPVMETTIEATITATGGGVMRTQRLSLQVTR